MSTAQRIAIVVLVVAVAVVGFVVLQPDDDSGSATGTTSVATTPSGGAQAGATVTRSRTTTAPRPRPAAPPVPRIVVSGGEPVGGVREIGVRKGETIRFTVVSDAPDDVHLHGYDVERPVAPGRPARFAVPADIEGIFQAELHHSGAQIAAVTVEP